MNFEGTHLSAFKWKAALSLLRGKAERKIVTNEHDSIIEAEEKIRRVLSIIVITVFRKGVSIDIRKEFCCKSSEKKSSRERDMIRDKATSKLTTSLVSNSFIWLTSLEWVLFWCLALSEALLNALEHPGNSQV